LRYSADVATVTALPAGRRERKKLATRNTLRATALDLVEQRGLGGVTVEAITEQAGVAPRTFFNYFASKEDAIINYDPERLQRVPQELRARPPGESALQALRYVLLEDLASREFGSADFLRAMRLVRADTRIRAAQAARWQEMEQVLIEAIAERTGLDPVADLYPSLVVATVVGAMRAAVRLWCDNDGATPIASLANEAIDALASGLPEPDATAVVPTRRWPAGTAN
jgi:AcrR family transcriptional regulator